MEPSSSHVPGPGSYGGTKSSFRTQLQKRLTDDPIAFSSTDMRPCLKLGSDTVALSRMRGSNTAQRAGCDPGPGDYDLEKQSIVQVIRKKTFGRHGIFGTCTMRFNPHCLPPDIARLQQYQSEEQIALDTPGPGAYEMDPAVLRDDASSQGRPKLKAQPVYSFRSSVERLDTQKYDARAPDILQVGSHQNPSVGANFSL